MFGTWISFGHPSIAELFSRTGADFIGIDLEHSTLSLKEAQHLIAAAQAQGVPAIPRVSSHNGEQIRRLLDSGADGIIVPNVSSLEQIEKIVEWSKYPPEGKRGFGVARAQGYGLDFSQYVERWNHRSTLLLQIESMEAVERAESLLSHRAVDGAMVGPYDLSGSLKVPGELDHPKVKEACARVVEACRRSGKACGTQIVDPDERNVSEALGEGYSFVILASDVFLLWKWSERIHRLLEGLRR
ncbi:MAG: 4-hydroxy-2-oxovalerate aldolase [Candidatus Omnitrophica bacterium]|nr:4-hydroxy-2-oxovalerate aldolase [Candidatus Omnitrophota bacterium]